MLGRFLMAMTTGVAERTAIAAHEKKQGRSRWSFERQRHGEKTIAI